MTNDERLGPPPVEPMSDAAWSRVERGVWSELDASATARPPARPPRRWWLVAGPVIAAAAVAVIVVGLRAGAPVVAIDEPSRVVSGSAPSSVSFGDAHIALDAETALVVSHDAVRPTVLLEHGAAWFTIAPRGSRPPFVVRAGDATVRVVGTRFRVARSDERITVEVDHGLVDVQFRGATARIAARQRWSSESPAQTESTTTTASLPAPAAPADPVATAEPPPTTPVVPPPVAPPVAPPHRPAPAHAATPRVPAAAPTTRAADPSHVDANATAGSDARTAGTPGARRDGDRAEYDRLAALEARQPDAALAGYLALARGTSRWADPALFAAARLAADRGDRRAVTLLGIYLQRFPAGANATDAKHLLARLQGDAP